jgi:flavin reductase
VLTVDADGDRLGLTVGSLVSLSLDPPLVGVSISTQAAMHELLAGDQEAIAQHFARGVPPLAHWHGIATRADAAGAPLIEDALGWLECEVRAGHETGDHTFFVGEVLAAERGRSAPPLVYVDQRYVTL